MNKKRVLFTLLIIFLIWGICMIGYFLIYVNCPKNPKRYTQTKYNYFISDKYRDFRLNSEEFFLVPGLKEHVIPQGITYSHKYNKFLIVGYHVGSASSVIFVVDYSSRNLEKTLLLKYHNSSNFNTHIGGITTDDETVWLSDNYKIYCLSLEEMLSFDDMSYINTTKPISSFAKGDYITYHNNTLWIGEYDYKVKYKTSSKHYYKDNKSIIAAFDLQDEHSDYLHPDYLISVPDRIQGLTFDEENNFILSRSFWSFQSSDLSIYQNVLDEQYEMIKIDNEDYKIWYLGNDKLLKNIFLPPMSEGLVYLDDDLYIIFESASSYYRLYTHDKVDSVIKLKKW